MPADPSLIFVRQCLLLEHDLKAQGSRSRSSFTISMPVGERRRAILDAICELWRGTPPLSKRSLRANASRRTASGGARRSRTDDILLAKQALYQLSYGPVPENGAKPRRAVGDAVLRLRTPSEPEVLVGPGRLELPTLRLSGVRSNHLSYGPMAARQPG